MVVSDNGRTFKGSQLRKYNAENGIRWRFNLSKSPWWGGMFERLIKSVKRCLVKAIGHKKLNYEEMLTILIEVEMVLNNRPLTYIEENEQCQALTPSHLFHGRRILDDRTASRVNVEDVTLDRRHATNRMKQIVDSVNHF